jgi:hypothetical protein
VRDYGAWLATVTTIWGVATLALFLPADSALRRLALAVSLASAAILFGMGLVRSVRGPLRQDQ